MMDWGLGRRNIIIDPFLLVFFLIFPCCLLADQKVHLLAQVCPLGTGVCGPLIHPSARL